MLTNVRCLLFFFVFTVSVGLNYDANRLAAQQAKVIAKPTGTPRVFRKMSLQFEGPQAIESSQSNPFLNYRMTVTFKHGDQLIAVPGYFAADGSSAETSADRGNIWQVNFWPEMAGRWTYEVDFVSGKGIAIDDAKTGTPVAEIHGQTGTIDVAPADQGSATGIFESGGRLIYAGEHYLQFSGSKNYFFKAGPDAPETLLGYVDFDGTIAGKKKVPLKTWGPHLQDFVQGDPTWQRGKGKGLIGAVNYLASKGCNAMSFLTYNAGGDGDNVWPHVSKNDKTRFDCSKLAQWEIVFDHAQSKGIFLHIKLQETENDDDRLGHPRTGHTGKLSKVAHALDGGDLKTTRKLYLRELIARFGYLPGLEWNLGEENTQSLQQQQAMANYIDTTDAFDHPIVIHTFPDQQDKVYQPLLGDKSCLTGASLQNMWNAAHQKTLRWVTKSSQSGRRWVVVNDEQGTAKQGVPPDPGYKGFSGTVKMKNGTYDLHDIRKHTLWGTLMAGGAGVNYYFGYELLENDLKCEDFRSRDRQWDYCSIAIDFFNQQQLPFEKMVCQNGLIGNSKNDNSKYCLCLPGEIYLVYLCDGGDTELDLRDAAGEFAVQWLNPRDGKIDDGDSVSGGSQISLASPDDQKKNDWLAIIRKK